MMLHRHFESEKVNENITRQSDLNQREQENDEFVSEIFPPDKPVKKPKRGRPRKSATN